MINRTYIVPVFICMLSTCMRLVSSQSQGCNATNSSNWGTLKSNPKLEELVETTLLTNGFTDGEHTLEFINWEEKTIRLKCPEKDPENDYTWKQHYHSGDKNRAECEDFNKTPPSGRWFTRKAPDKCGEHAKLFRTYSCRAVTNDCVHYVHVFIRPVPKTTIPVHIALGKSGSFSCEAVRCEGQEKDSKNETDSLFGPFIISWRGPNGEILKDDPSSNMSITVDYDIDNQTSTVHIHEASPDTTGIFECILTSRMFGLTSSPDDARTEIGTDGVKRVVDVTLFSGIRYTGYVHVHSRPTWYVFVPLGIIAILLVLLVFMILFCPTREDEADVDADDEEEIAEMKKLARVRLAEAEAEGESEVEPNGLGLRRIQEERESLDNSSSGGNNDKERERPKSSTSVKSSNSNSSDKKQD